MASKSSPPLFQVEDNSDEDFFDKLVDDDDGVEFQINSSSSAAPVINDGNESNQADKAFANSNVNELDDGDAVGFAEVCSKDWSAEVQKVGNIEGNGNLLVATDSFVFDNLVENTGNGNGDSEVPSDATMVSKSSDDASSDHTVVTENEGVTGATGVKEVEWSGFHADSVQNDVDGFGSGSDFFSDFEGANGVNTTEDKTRDFVNNIPQSSDGDNVNKSSYVENTNIYDQYGAIYNNGVPANHSGNTQDLNSSEYWENQYPGWKYDPNTGQWYQIDGYDVGASVQADASNNVSSAWGVADRQTELSYLQQSTQSATGSVAEAGRTVSLGRWNQGSVVGASDTTTSWNQVSHASSQSDSASSDRNLVSQDNDGYPSHMVFDPQYPGWYYDTIANEWRILESVHSTSQVQHQVNQDGYGSMHESSWNEGQKTNDVHGLGQNDNSQSFGSQVLDSNWHGPVSTLHERSSGMWQPQTAVNGEANSFYSEKQLMNDQSRQNAYMGSHGNQKNSVQQGVTGLYYANTGQIQDNFSAASQSQSFAIAGNLRHHLNDSGVNNSDQNHLFNGYYNINNSVNFPQQQIQSAQISHSPASGRSSAGRPAHALVAFGFGGKLIVMKHSNSTSFGAQNLAGESVSILNLTEVVNNNGDALTHGIGASSYFQALCWQPAPGPLTGGNVGTKELNKWVDERIANTGSANMDFSKIEVSKLLLSLLKVACQYYGKLRSPYGTDAVLKEADTPESAVAKLFASAKGSPQFNQCGSVAQCLQQMPSEGQMRATATEVQNLLVSGRKKEALQCAQEGQLWGPALVLSAQLGDQFYVETVKQMALHQLRAGSPLRTLCLLIAGQPADVFSSDDTVHSNTPGAVHMPQQPIQVGANCMLDDWEENLAVITANRTKDDELVLIHLGDCLWKERSNIIAAHICYLVAEASFEPFSDSARLCLVGADHLKYPRTYASPEAIQRTEIYEYSKTLGNSQFVLLPFQPYKLIYAHMLAEVGRISEALKYCQAVLKSLKTGRNPEAENRRQLVSSLEERIKAHQQGGFSTNLAPKEFIGKLLNLFDSTAHRVVGGLPPPIPIAGAATHGIEKHHQPRVSTSQSTLAMSSLVPSESMEPITEWAADNNKMSLHTRSVSEPDFGRSPRQVDSSKDASSTGMQNRTSAGTSRFGRFGSSLLQKTVGLVLKPRQGREAKLGDTNKFYYDEKLKRWVEEGADPPAEEAAVAPPPTTSHFQNGTSDYYTSNRLQNDAPMSSEISDHNNITSLDNSGMPPLPPTTNQYSARGRMGVRSRYVDTFNQGGGKATTNQFQSPPVPSSKPATGANPKFFIPSPVSNMDQQSFDAPLDGAQNTSSIENSSKSSLNDSFHSSALHNSVPMQRFGSMNNIRNNEMCENGGSFMTQSRRTASWSGSFHDSFSNPQKGELEPLEEVMGMHSQASYGNFRDDLHEVEL